MTDTSAALRLAVAALTGQQRAALAGRFATTATVTERSDPTAAAFWRALADLVDEIDRTERARERAEVSVRKT